MFLEIYVKEQCRRKGIAKRLLQILELIGRKKNIFCLMTKVINNDLLFKYTFNCIYIIYNNIINSHQTLHEVIGVVNTLHKVIGV